MPVIIPKGLEEEWISSVKNAQDLKALKPLMTKWDPEEWTAEPIIKPNVNQLSFLWNHDKKKGLIWALDTELKSQ